MNVDFPTLLGVVSVSFLCIFATSMIVFENDSYPIEIEDSSSKIKMEKYAVALSEINQQGIIYQNDDNSEQFVQQMNLMQQKQKEITSEILGLDIDEAYVAEGWNFPFMESSKVTIRIPELKKPVCDIPEKIPSHLQLIGQSEMFQMFAGKYSQHDLTIDISDERNHGGLIHYNLAATSDDGLFHTYTYFHLDSCTDEMQWPYFLLCKDIKNDKHIGTSIKSEIVSSLADKSFCNISLEPWHQGIRDYQIKIDDSLDIIQKNLSLPPDETTSYEYMSEFRRLGLLLDITRYYESDVLETKKLQKDLAEYERKYGSLPDDLLELMEMKK